jgi:hypothetical protein
MKEETLTRRDFLARAVALGVMASGTAAILAACEKGGGDEALSCSDVSGLTEIQTQTRTALQYVEASTEEGKSCTNCSQFVAPAEAGSCGTCNLVAGPINPQGYCVSWVAIPA